MDSVVRQGCKALFDPGETYTCTHLDPMPFDWNCRDRKQTAKEFAGNA